jgi:predicted PurR-regulated permease PerM
MNQDKSFSWAWLVKALLGLVVALGVGWFLYTIREILVPFVLAFILSYVLNPLVDRMEGRGMSRGGSISLIFVGIVALGLIGFFTVGKRLSEQVMDITEQFLRQETVVKEFSIANLGEEAVAVDVVWKRMRPGKRFALVDPPDFPLELAPGARQVLQLRFSPRGNEQCEGILRLTSPELNAPFELRVRGNAAGEQEEFWSSPEYLLKVNAQPLEFSAGGIDFGKAGPSIITRMSEVVSGLQPQLQAYLGVEMDLEKLVKEKGREMMNTLVGRSSAFMEGVFSGLALLVIVPFAVFFFLKEGRRLTHELIELVPNAYFELCLNLIYQINGQIGGYLRGQMLETGIVALLSVVALTLIGLPNAIPIGLMAGAANMIPYLGPLIGGIMASVVALSTGGGGTMVLYVIVAFAVIQMLDNLVVQPIIVAKSVDLHPLLVMLVVSIGSQLLGIMGMLIAVPLTGILKVSTQTIYRGIKGYRAG